MLLVGGDPRYEASSLYTQSDALCVSTQLFELHEEIKSVKKKMETLQKSLLRHKGRLVSVRNVV